MLYLDKESQGGAILSAAITMYLTFQHFNGVGSWRRAFRRESMIATFSIICMIFFMQMALVKCRSLLEHWDRLECRSNRKTNSVGKISFGSTCRGPWRLRRGRRGGAVVGEEIADGVQGRRRRGTVATAVGLPVAYSAPLDRSRVGMVEQWRQRNS